jgi:hypothetical protein
MVAAAFLAILDILVTVVDTVSPAAATTRFLVAVFRGRDAMELTVGPIPILDAVPACLMAAALHDAPATAFANGFGPQRGSLEQTPGQRTG